MYRPTIQIALIACFLSVLTGCGGPSQQYAASTAASTYFTVPISWREISFEKLTAYEKSQASGEQKAIAESVIWQIAYTPLKKLELSQVYSAESFDQPIVVARVRNLTYQEINQISYDALRNMVIPIQTWSQTPEKAPPGFSIVSDAEIYDQGVRGIRTIFTFDNEGTNLTIDQVAMVSDDRRILYLLFSRCITTCYEKNQKVIDEIVTSFSVRGKK